MSYNAVGKGRACVLSLHPNSPPFAAGRLPHMAVGRFAAALRGKNVLKVVELNTTVLREQDNISFHHESPPYDHPVNGCWAN